MILAPGWSDNWMQDGDDGSLSRAALPQTLLFSWTTPLRLDQVYIFTLLVMFDVTLLPEKYQTQSGKVESVKWEGWIIARS